MPTSFIDQIRERAATDAKSAAATLGQQIAARAGLTVSPVPMAQEPPTSTPAANAAAQPRLSVVFGHTARSSAVERRALLAWPDFVRLLRLWKPAVGALALAEYAQLKSGTPAQRRQAAAAKDTGWYAPVRLAGSTREAAAVLELGMLVLDFDAGLLTREEISQPLGDAAHLIISTRSHHPEAPRYRLHLPYTRPVSPAEHAPLFEHFACLYPAGAVDKSARDASRLWFQPACWADTIELREFHEIAGRGFFDPDTVLADPAPEGAEADDSEQTFEVGFADAPPSMMSHAEALRANRALMPQPDEIHELLGAVRLKGGGSQRDPFLKIVRALKHYGQTWGDDELAWGLLDEWARTQRDYNQQENRRIWDSFTHLRGTTVGTLYHAAAGLDPGFDCAQPATPAWPAPLADPTQPFADDASAIRYLTSRHPFIADQQGYLDRCTGAVLQRNTIDEMYQRWMPPGEVAPDGKRLPSRAPSVRLRYSRQVVTAASLGYMPGVCGKYADQNGRARWSLWTPPRSPWRMPITPDAQRVLTAVLEHVLVQTGPDGAAAAERYLDRLAWLLQHMSERAPGVMLFVSGPQGTGKTTLSYEIPAALFGGWNVAKIGQKQLEGNFNSFYQHAQVVVYEEIALNHARDARKLYNELKDTLTSQTLRINAKYVADYEIQNQTTIFATSNYTDAVSLPEADRRWDVIAVNECAPPSKLMEEFYSLLRSPEGAAQLRDLLLVRDVSQYNPLARPPMTEAKRRMIEETRDGLEADVEDAIESQGRDIGRLETLRAVLDGAPYHRRLARTQLVGILRRLGAQPLPSKLRVRTPDGRSLDPLTHWAWRNADVWVNSSTIEAAAHVETGAPGPTRPLRIVKSKLEEA